jgi:hypothetical protein
MRRTDYSESSASSLFGLLHLGHLFDLGHRCGHGDEKVLGVVEDGNPLESRKVTNPDVVVDVEMAHIDFDEGRNLGRQRFDLDFILDRAEDAALFDAGRIPHEMEAHLGLDLFGEGHLDEVDMSKQGPVGMTIDDPDQGRDPGGVVDLEVDEDVESGIGVKSDTEVVVVDSHVLWLGASPIYNGRNLALTT